MNIPRERIVGEPMCATCKFYDEHCCHHEPPRPLLIPLQVLQEHGPPSPVTLWPPVPDEGWCGGYVRKITVA